MKFPKGIKKCFMAGYECSYCGAMCLNTQNAKNHDCEDYKERCRNKVVDPGCPNNGYHLQAKRKSY